MKDDEKRVALEKSLQKKSRRILKDAMAKIDFTKHVVPVKDEEEGETYYAIEQGSRLKKHHVMVIDDALIECARLYSNAGIPNRSRYYRKITRMVHYALYEIETRELLEEEVSRWHTLQIEEEKEE